MEGIEPLVYIKPNFERYEDMEEELDVDDVGW